MSKVTAKVWTGSGTSYKSVDEWTLGHSFPGGTDVPTLWLDSVTRKGFDASGASITLPALTTHGRKDRNRADYDPNAGMADPQKYRIDYLDTETGGRIEVSYLPTNEPGDACTWWSGKSPSQWPNYNHNASRCFMQYTTRREGTDPAWTWWHKFVVDKVTEKDLVGGSPDQVSSYQYTMDGATSNHPLVLWGYTTSVWASPHKAMSAWKGYPTVITTTGAAGGTQSKTKRVYYRGLDRDTGLDGASQEFWRLSSVADSLGVSVTDHAAMAGQVREEIVYDGATGPELTKTIHTASAWQTGGGALPSWQTPPERVAYMNRETSAKTLTKIADGSWRTTETASAFDTTFGTPTQVDDKGQTNPPPVVDDDVCTRYTYARNTQDLTLRLGTGSGLVQPTGTVVSADWSAYDHVFTPGDFTGDGKADVLALNRLNRGLYLFTGDGSGGFSAGPAYVAGFPDDTDQIFSGGDFSGDGKPDVIYRRSADNNLYMISGNGVGGWVTGTSVQIGNGWGDAKTLSSVGDFSGDGKTDVLFLSSSGTLLVYTGNGASGWLGSSQIATGWTDKDKIFGKGTVTGDAKADLYARNTAGDLHLYPGTGTSLGTPTLVGGGWNVYEQLLTAGDITGDGKADVWARYGGARLTGVVARTETVGVGCDATATYPADLVADMRVSFDGLAYGSMPMKGLPTRSEQVKTHNGSIPTAFVTTETGYDTWGRPIWAKDSLGNQTDTLYTHNTAGLMSSMKVTTPPPVTGAARHEATTTFDVLRGQPLAVTDPNGKVTTGSYDALGRMLKVWKPGNTSGTPDAEYMYSVTKTSWPHIQTKALGPNGNQIVSFEIYDGLLRARQTQTTAPDGKRTIADTQYDSRGLKAKASMFYNDASGPNSTLYNVDAAADALIDLQIRFVYDGVGRQTFEQLYKQNVEQWHTETRHEGDRTGVIPPTGGTVTQDIVDARGRVVEKRQYESTTGFTGALAKTEFTYDDAGRLIVAKDPAGNQWTYEFDLLGRNTKTTDPDAGVSTSSYDDAGRTLSTTDSRLQVLFYEYDNLGRKTKQRADTVGGLVMADWVYDSIAKGQLTSTSRYDSGNTYISAVGSYDDGYRPLSSTYTVPGFGTGGPLIYTLDNTYKVDGSLETQVFPAVGGLPGETITHTYTTTGLPDKKTSGQGTYVNGTTYTYDGQVAQLLLGAAGKQVKLTNTLDPTTRRLVNSAVATETTPNVFSTQFDDTYSHDQTGNITSVAGRTNGTADQEECFRYDYLRRVTKAWTQVSDACTTPQRTGADPYWREWTFDTVGNRLTQIDYDSGVGNTNWTYDVGAAFGVKPHQVKNVTGSGPKLGTPTRTFNYDVAGNTTSRSTETGTAQTLTWGKDGSLATVTQGSDLTSYVYDTGGNRLLATTAAKTTLYLPDGTELEKMTSGGAILGTRYYGGYAVRDAAGLRWITHDHHGTGTAQIKSDTLAVDRRRTMPYGEPRGTQPSGWVGTKGFVGGTKDGTGLTHLGAREYDPSLGRFISVDPLMDLTDPQQWHAYTYSNSNPISWSDPDGQILCGDDGCNQVATPNSNGGYHISGTPQSSVAPCAPNCRPLRPQDKEILASSTILLGYLVIAPSRGDIDTILAQVEAEMCSWRLACGRDEFMWEEQFQLEALVAICSANPSWCGIPSEELLGLAFAAATEQNGGGGRAIDKALDKMLPSALRVGHNGQEGVSVYRGWTDDGQMWVYSGITSQELAKRQAQHLAAKKTFKIVEIASGLTRGEARAVEQALIERGLAKHPKQMQNINNSISPKHSYQEKAIEWGEAWLRANGI